MKFRLLSGLLACILPLTAMAAKVAIVSTSSVLEHKFELMAAAAQDRGLKLAWTQVDREGEAGVARVLEGADFVIIDTPGRGDQAQVKRVAGDALRALNVPVLRIHSHSARNPMDRQRMSGKRARRVLRYYTIGMRVNRHRMAEYLKVWLSGGDPSTVKPPKALPNGGIYHPDAKRMIFASLREYLDWWQQAHGETWQGRPVIGMGFASSYLSDGQTRHLYAFIEAVEAAGGVPVVFYRGERQRPSGAQAQGSREHGNKPDHAGSRQGTKRSRGQAKHSGPPIQIGFAGREGFLNPKPLPPARMMAATADQLITLDGELLLDVLAVNTFLGINPDARKAWYQSLGIPVLELVHYRSGNRQDYAQANAGIGRARMSWVLTIPEYIGIQDPVVVTTNQDGELVPMPAQMHMLVGKMMNLARLGNMPNAEKHVALLFYNHPPGQHNMGASGLNVPRSIAWLVKRLRAVRYAFEAVTEDRIIAAIDDMLGPVYRKSTIADLMQTRYWAFLPLEAYKAWFATIPQKVRERITDEWGKPAGSPWVVQREDGVTGFVIPRLKLGNLVVMPQPPRGVFHGDDAKKLYHDATFPVNHFYYAAYLWIRSQFVADALIHFGTHGTQEWTPGKENGLWAWDAPNMLVGNVPVIYPYIIDNMGEAVHVKRRGRGLIVSHLTPPFSPAGLSDKLIRINDVIRQYQTVAPGPVKQKARELIIDLAVTMHINRDLSWTVADLKQDFEAFLRELENYLETIAAASQPLGLHTLGRDMSPAHTASTIMMMLGEPLYAAFGIEDAGEVFARDYEQIQKTAPYRFVEEWVLSDKPLEQLDDKALVALAEQGRAYAGKLHAENEIESMIEALDARWINPSYGGDPIRNPDALPTGRNMYGFDPNRVPTRLAYQAGKEQMKALIETYRNSHDGRFPHKLAFTLWSNETMRHLGMLEGQILYALGVRPVWDRGGRVVGVEKIPLSRLGRPRIDVVLSITGLYRDQFPPVMEMLNKAIMLAATAEDEPLKKNFVRANSLRILHNMLERGLPRETAEVIAHTRIFSEKSGTYGTGVPAATLASSRWKKGDGKIARLFLDQMGWAFGPNPENWSRKFEDGSGDPVKAFAAHLHGTDAVVFSRSSNLHGMLDTDHPFEFLGGLSKAVQYIDGEAPQLYVYNMRDPSNTRLVTAAKFLAIDLRSIYQHKNWIAEMKKEGYSGTLELLNAVNNFWGWQVMDASVVRDDQWQAFFEIYVQDRFNLELRKWFEKYNPSALAQIAQRMLEAIRKDYWQASKQTLRALVKTYRELASQYDIHTGNEAFKAYVQKVAAGFGMNTASRPAPSAAPSQARPNPAASQAKPQAAKQTKKVTGKVMREVSHKTKRAKAEEQLLWFYIGLLALILVSGFAWQAWRTRSEARDRVSGPA